MTVTTRRNGSSGRSGAPAEGSAGGGTATLDEPLKVIEPSAKADEAAAQQARRRRRLVRIGTALGVVGVVVAGLVLLALLPTRSFLGQRAQIRAAEQRLAEIQAANDKLQQRVDALSTPGEVDLVAKAQFNLVKPGESAFAVLPAPKITIESLPAQWPYSVVQQVVATRR